MLRQTGLALAFVFGTASALPAAAADTTADTVVATVDGTDITIGHMIALRGQLPAQYQSLPDDVLFKGILDQLVQQTLLSKSAEGSITKRDTLAMDNDRRAYLSAKILDAVTRVAVTDEALKSAYDAKYAAAEPKPEFNASHILVATEDEASAIKADLDAGGDFAKLAAEKSTDGSGPGGGELGWFGVGMMVKPFEDAVLTLKAGEISGPIQSQFGWHIIKLNETRTAAPPSIDDIRDELVADVQGAAVEARVNELTAAASIVRTDEGIDPVVLRDDALLGD